METSDPAFQPGSVLLRRGDGGGGRADRPLGETVFVEQSLAGVPGSRAGVAPRTQSENNAGLGGTAGGDTSRVCGK